ncbi:MAG: DUF5711 family protein [Agathobaculum sp.]|jgi:hypothetical protein|uniref:DUF5711 family protein n=1 Tax=Agathobaculum sp. TaxID=2048138 RepID=UPI003D8F879D
MDERHSKQNIIRFPSSREERRRILRENEDRRVRIVSLLRSACGWLLAACTLLFLLFNFRLFTPSAIRSAAEYAIAGLRQHEGDITTITYENGSFADGVLFESGLAYADSDSLYLAKPGSITTMRCPLGYSAPVVEAAGNYVLAYDRGGTQALLANSVAATAELTLSSPIITGSIGQNGHFVLVTDEQGYRTAAAVYDTRGKEVFKYQSSEYYIVSAALSPDCSTIAVLGFRQQGISLDSHVLFYSVSTGELESDVTLTDALGMELCYAANGAAAVLCDNGLYLAGRKDGSAEKLLSYSSSDLLTFTVQDDALALALRSYTSSARSDLYVLRANGGLEQPLPLAEEPSAVALSSTGVAALSASGVSVYDAAHTPLWRNSEAVGARRILLIGDGTLYALYTKNTRLFTAHSERSEELPDAE